MVHRAALIRVQFQTGSPFASGESMALGLILRFGALDFIGNSACFADVVINSDSFISFGVHYIYIAVTEQYYDEVHCLFVTLCRRHLQHQHRFWHPCGGADEPNHG
jgi:hypothetical protein